MQIIKIQANENGSHENARGFSSDRLPTGWARVPDDMDIPDSFPFVDIEVSGGVVTTMTAREVPEKVPVQETRSQLDRIEAQVMYTAMETGTLLEVE